MIQGQCLCGEVRYEAHGEPFNATLCHCTDCRKASGAPALAWFSVPTDALRWTAGRPRLYRSSSAAVRGFCAACGTTLTWQSDEWPDEIDVTIASLDDPEALPPADHTFVRSRLGWIKVCDGLPEYETTRAAGQVSDKLDGHTVKPGGIMTGC